MACMECRLAKTRCKIAPVFGSTSQQKICERCQRHGFSCIFTAARRGRKAKSKLFPLEQGVAASVANYTFADDFSFAPQPEQQVEALHAPNPVATDGSSLEVARRERLSPLPYEDLIVNRSVTLLDLLRPLPRPSCLSRYVEFEGSEPSQTNTGESSGWDKTLDDPISSGIIKEDAARALFDFFMEHMTRWSNLLDRRLHTHDFVRKRSNFLHVAILALASKFSLDPSHPQVTLWCAGLRPRPPSEESISEAATGPASKGARLRQLLYVLCQDLAARAFADGEDRSVECCQAFILTSCWRSLHDGVSSLQFGFALRMGCDLRLDAELPAETLTSELDDTSKEARKWGFRNRQRTFLVLFMMDKAQQIVNDLDTRAIPYNHRLLSQASEWFRRDKATVGDGLLCACVEFRKVQDKYVSLLRDLGHAANVPSARAKRSWLLDAIQADLNDCEQRWQAALTQRDNMHEEQLDILSAMCMLQFWRNSISLHLCCSLLALQRDDSEESVPEDSPSSQGSSTDTRAARVLKFWSVRRRGRWNETDVDSHLGFIPPLLLLARGDTNQSESAFDSILVFHCTASAQGVLDALSSLPPARLRTTPDPTNLQCLHAATVVVSAALSYSSAARIDIWPPADASLSAQSAFASSVYSLISKMRDNCVTASLSTDDTVHHIAEYMESLLSYMRETDGSSTLQG